MKLKHEAEARGFTNLSLIDSDSGSSGSWIEWETETYVGEKNGRWYKIVVRDLDNPHRPRSVSVDADPITPQQASQLRGAPATTP